MQATVLPGLLLGLVLAPAVACACGDKLVALGGGLPFERVVMSRHPGHVVLLLSPGSGLNQANDRFNIASTLSLVGHDVTIVPSQRELDDLLASERPDIVLVDAAEAQQGVARTSSAAAAPTVLPVHFDPSTPSARSRQKQGNCVAEIAGRGSRQLLRTIEQVLAARSEHRPLSCERLIVAQAP